MATLMALILSAAFVVAAPSPDPQPTTAPRPTPQPTATAPTDTAKALAVHIPSDIRTSCLPTTDALADGATAQLDCDFGESKVPDSAVYVQFSDAASMKAFAERMSGSKPLGNEACAAVTDLQEGGKAPYSVDNKPRGTVWCYRNDDNDAVLMWTDDDLNIGTVAIESHDTDFEAFIEWYKTAGPVA